LLVVAEVDIADMALVDNAALLPNQAAVGTVVAVDRMCTAMVARVRSVVAVGTVVVAGH
jgi:hypothetical protein